MTNDPFFTTSIEAITGLRTRFAAGSIPTASDFQVIFDQLSNSITDAQSIRKDLAARLDALEEKTNKQCEEAMARMDLMEEQEQKAFDSIRSNERKIEALENKSDEIPGTEDTRTERDDVEEDMLAKIQDDVTLAYGELLMLKYLYEMQDKDEKGELKDAFSALYERRKGQSNRQDAALQRFKNAIGTGKFNEFYMRHEGAILPRRIS